MAFSGTVASTADPPAQRLVVSRSEHRRIRANDLSDTVKLVILLGQCMQDSYQGRYYAKAQNLSRDAKSGDPVTRGMLLRLERASNPDKAKEAADAFQWWLEQNHLMEIPEGGGCGSPLSVTLPIGWASLLAL